MYTDMEEQCESHFAVLCSDTQCICGICVCTCAFIDVYTVMIVLNFSIIVYNHLCGKSICIFNMSVSFINR